MTNKKKSLIELYSKAKYLSYSQYSSYFKGQYIKRYLEGEKIENIYVTLGKKVADQLENGEKTFNIEIPEVREKKLEYVFKGIPLLGYLDGFSEKEMIIDEYKTGTKNWTQRKVDKHEQLTFYAIMISALYKIPIEKIRIRLWWLETFIDTDGELKLSGHVEHKETKRTKEDRNIIYPKMKEAWEGIKQLRFDYINKIN